MSKRKTLFIINPKSGQKRGKHVAPALEKKLDRSLYDWSVYYTRGPGDAALKSKSEAGKMDMVVAVGGDGSVNEVARGLIGSRSVLGIIPVGSGNGLARYLKIPMRIPDAIGLLNNGYPKKIDTLMINDEVMLNTAGVGFDARVCHAYSRYVHRGISSYVKSVLKEIIHYQERKYKFYFDNEELQEEAFLLTFSNSSQYGNNVYIAPQAKIDDGLFEVCMLKKFPPWVAPIIVIRLLNKTIDQSKYYTCYKCKELVLDRGDDLEAHIDGEAITLPKKIQVKLIPHSLKVITG
jgi:YegS/Rv2252/BmrU family lipid kinase